MEAVVAFVVVLGVLSGIFLQATTGSNYVRPEYKDWHK